MYPFEFVSNFKQILIPFYSKFQNQKSDHLNEKWGAKSCNF